MKRAFSPPLAMCLAIFFVFVAALPNSASARSSMAIDDSPTELAMMGDAIIVRPFMLGATVLGTAVFTVTLPFSALGGNTSEAAEALVRSPARTTFLRCLGCTTIQHDQRQSERQRNSDTSSR